MTDRSLDIMPVSVFSQEEQSLLLTFERQLQMIVETLKAEKQKNKLFRKEKLKLEQKVNQFNEKMAEMAMIHQKQKEKLKNEFQTQIKKIQSMAEKPHSKIICIKKKPTKKHFPSFTQPRTYLKKKSLSKGFKIMLLQQFIQFFACMVLTRIKFPSKFRSFKRILPMTFILLRLGVFILVTHFKRVCGYVNAVVRGEEGMGRKIQAMVRFLCAGNTKEDKDEKDITKFAKKEQGLWIRDQGQGVYFGFFD